MTITLTALDKNSGANVSSIVSASISPTNGRMVYVFVTNLHSGGASIPTISGLSQTWENIGSYVFFTYGRQTVFRAKMSTPGTGTITIDFGGVQSYGVGYEILEGSSDIDSTGTNGANSVVQVVQSWSIGVTASATLAAFSQPQNAALVGVSSVYLDSSYLMYPLATAPGTGLTEVIDGVSGEGSSGFYGTNVSSPTVDFSTYVLWSTIALELKSTSADPPPSSSGTTPTHTAWTRTGLTASSTSHAMNLPGSIVANNGLIALVWGLNTQAISISGWTQLGQASLPTNSRRFAVFVKKASGSEGSTQTVTTAAANQIVALVTKIDNWYEDLAGIEINFASVTTNTPNSGNLTPSWGALDTLWITGFGGSVTNAFSAAPTNYSDYSSDQSSYVCHGAFRELNASSENPGAFTGTISSQENIAVTIAVRPAILYPTPFISSITPDEVYEDDTGVVIAGFDFNSTKGDGAVYLGNTNDRLTAVLVEQTTTSWGDTSITFSITKGTINYGERFIFVKSLNEKWSGGYPVTLLEPEPIPVDPPPVFGDMAVVIYGSPAVGGIVDIIEMSIEEETNAIGTSTFSAPRKAEGVNLATIGREIGIFRTGEGEIWKGFITDRKKTISEDGSNLMRFDCFGLGYELQRIQCWRGLRFEQVEIQDALDEILSGTGWTSSAVGEFIPITKMFDNMNLLACIDELAKIGNAYYRIDPVSRHITIRQYADSSSMVIANVDQADENSKVGIISSLDDYSEDGSSIVNRLVVESKSDTDEILTLFESTRTTPYTIQNMLRARPSVVSVAVGYGSTDGDDEIINLINNSSGENRGYALLLLQIRSDNDSSKNIRGGSIGGRPLTNGLMGAAILDSGIGYRMYTFLGLNPPRGDLGLSLDIKDGTIAADLIGVGVVAKDCRYIFHFVSGLSEQRGTAGTTTAYGYPGVAGEDYQLSVLIRTEDSPATPGAGQELILDTATVGGRIFVSIQDGSDDAESSWTLSSSGDVWFHQLIQMKAKKIYYIEDATSVASYGVHEEYINLGTFLKISEQHATYIADAMYDWSVDYITKMKDVQKFYDFSVAWLPRGPLDWDVGSSIHTIYRDEEEDINDNTLICTRRVQNFDSSGNREWKLTVSNKVLFRNDEQGTWLLESLKQRVAAIQINQT